MNISGSDEMSRRIRAFDWSSTPLGPRAEWPQSLLTALSILLGSRVPMQLLWGPEYTHLYNEAYIPIAGDKHPAALGRPAAAIWPEIWSTVGPMLDQVASSGEATLAEDLLLVIDRRGYLEESYYTFSYSPVNDLQGVVSGIFIAVTETTARVLRERRLRAIADLTDALAASASGQLVSAATAALGRAAADIPFALCYLLAADERSVRLVFAQGLGPDHPAVPRRIDLDDAAAPWPLAQVLASGRPLLLADLPARPDMPPDGLEGAPPQQALVLPIAGAAGARLIGCLVAGLSPRLRLDEDYRDFLDRVAAQLGAAADSSIARAEAQAMIRTRDDFLSIAAHELKTPLTPIIGKLQLLQRRLDGALSERDRHNMRTVVDEALRLNGLIDALLDISRLRSGQLAVSRAAVDLSELAAQVADEVGPTLSKHTLVVEAPAERVVISGDALRLAQVLRNMVSNAIKYSPDGGPVTVRLGREGKLAHLSVSDNGIGVSAEVMPRLFERYYRVESGDSSIGGLGVGLYVANEIVRLHGGRISVASAPGEGSTFTVALPIAG
jgi:signal transduction histidine kinase